MNLLGCVNEFSRVVPDRQQIDYCLIPGGSVDLVRNGSCIYIAAGTSGLCVVSVSAPQNPIIIGNCDAPASAYSVANSGTTTCISIGSQGSLGFRVIDVSDPCNPTEIGYHDTYSARNLAISDGYIYVADWTAGLQIFEYLPNSIPEEGETESDLLEVVSNPSQFSTTLRFVLPRESNIELTIFDLSGRQIDAPASGVHQTGQHEIVLCGLFPGVYFAKLTTDSSTITESFVVVR